MIRTMGNKQNIEICDDNNRFRKIEGNGTEQKLPGGTDGVYIDQLV